MWEWVSFWPGVPGIPTIPAVGAEPFIKFQKKWTEFVGEIVKKQRETLEAQFSAGLKNIEEAFKLADVKNPEELRTKTIELWQKVFETLHQSFEAQVRDMQTIAGRWTELASKGAA